MRTNSKDFEDVMALDYEHLDPASLNLLAQAIEAKARRMRAEAIRDLIGRAVISVRNGLSMHATARAVGGFTHAR
jgi:hypothetical protein